MKKVILDVDTGIDDALAISYAIHSPELDVIGITTTFGNTSVDITTANTLKVLNVLGRLDIPVAAGNGHPLFRDDLKEKATRVHGEDGLGNTNYPLPETREISQHAVDFLVEQIRNHPKEVTVIAVAAMTNLAMAIVKDPEIVELVGEIVIMGGAVTAPGNVTPHAEANILADPEAAEVLFRSGAPITMVGLDVTMQTLLHRHYVEEWRQKGTSVSRFMADMTEYYMDAYLSFYPDILGCALHDPLAVGIVIDRSFVKTKAMHVQVDTEGELSKGRTIGDLRGKPANPPNMQVCLEVDTDRFVTHFVERVAGV